MMPAVSLLVICTCTVVEKKYEVSAVIINPDTASRAELFEVVSTALHDAKIILADNALTENNTLVIDRKLFRNLSNSPVMGRELGHPILFQLFKNGNQCVLVQKETNNSWILKHTKCKAYGK